MAKFTAIFSNGEKITRTSKTDYKFAWSCTWRKNGQVLTRHGMSKTVADAVKASKPYMPYDVINGMRKSDRDFATSENQKFLSTCEASSDIVAVIAE